jgi:threonine dehydrogenase-like Zn-dependent dehydrogenase
MGTDDVLDLDDVKDPADRRSWVRDHTDGRGADVVIQVANSLAVPEGLSMLRTGGRYVNIGGGGKASIDVNALPREGIVYTIMSGEPRHWLQALEFLASRRDKYPFEQMISASYPLDQVNDAIQAMAKYEVVKAVIYPHQN